MRNDMENKMYIRNLSTELAELWVRDLLISGWTSSAVVAAIRALDNPKPLERRKLIVRWSLPIPPAPDDPLIDENGDELLNEDGRRRRRGSATDHIAINANKEAAKREAARAAAIE